VSKKGERRGQKRHLGEKGSDGLFVLGDKELHPKVANHEVGGTRVLIHEEHLGADLRANVRGCEGEAGRRRGDGTERDAGGGLRDVG
jgi:hypothetical protein